ncbi:hypothetical protein FACS1894190_02600 [Spirochaetia bacterium]|nr:hypothetical protein FACS1894190_02600 [Spirochaetia bacterium]
MVEEGTLESLHSTLDFLEQNGIKDNEFGRVMAYISGVFIKEIYGEDIVQLKIPDPPRTQNYTKIINDAFAGSYTKPSIYSADYLEYTLPFLTFIRDKNQTNYSYALEDLLEAEKINPKGVMALYFLGYAHENLGRAEASINAYNRAIALYADCYPAVLGITRILQSAGEYQTAIQMLEGIAQRFPQNILIKRQLASSYYNMHEWTKASKVLNETLQLFPHDSELLLMQSRVELENMRYAQARMLLDNYDEEFSETRDSRFFRARLFNEGLKDREGAIGILRFLNKSQPNDFEVQLYLTRMLLESENSGEAEEGRKTLQQLLYYGGGYDTKDAPFEVLELAAKDAIRRQDWQEAQSYHQRILPQRRESADLLDAFSIEMGLGNKNEALNFARELRERFPGNEEGTIAYITALIDLKSRRDEATRLIAARLGQLVSGAYKSRYYFLRSRLRVSGDDILADLRAALFENPRNTDAIKALVTLYDNRGDDTRAVYYLRQALALASKDNDLQKYRAKYADKL